MQKRGKLRATVTELEMASKERKGEMCEEKPKKKKQRKRKKKATATAADLDRDEETKEEVKFVSENPV